MSKKDKHYDIMDSFGYYNALEDALYIEGLKKVKSDGGSSSYYELPEHATELKHLIAAKGMSFARGNVFKACYRLGEKEGADTEYDINKIIFFAYEMLEMIKRGEKV